MTITEYPVLHVALEVRGSVLDPADLTRVLQLDPTSFWSVGDTDTRTSKPRDDAGWVFRLPDHSALSYESQVEELLGQLSGREDMVRSTVQKDGISGRISCVGVITTIVPSILFSNKVLRRIAELGVDLDVDLFLSE